MQGAQARTPANEGGRAGWRLDVARARAQGAYGAGAGLVQMWLVRLKLDENQRLKCFSQFLDLSEIRIMIRFRL